MTNFTPLDHCYAFAYGVLLDPQVRVTTEDELRRQLAISRDARDYQCGRADAEARRARAAELKAKRCCWVMWAVIVLAVGSVWMMANSMVSR